MSRPGILVDWLRALLTNTASNTPFRSIFNTSGRFERTYRIGRFGLFPPLLLSERGTLGIRSALDRKAPTRLKR